MKEKLPVYVTLMHYTDLRCAAMNFGEDGQAIWNDLHDTHTFMIDDVPVKGRFYADYSVSFMYPQGAAEARKLRLQRSSS